MAISLENENKVWQRVNIALKGATPTAQMLFKALKQSLAQDFRDPDLQFVALSNVTADVVVADAACRVRGIYLKKQATATASYFKGNDSATATVASANQVMIGLSEASKESFLIATHGLSMANGFTVGADTSGTATTNSTSGDGPNGFVIISAP